MARVELTRHLFQFFPDLEGQELEIAGATVREIVDGMEAVAPGFAFYVCDERGRLRQHVNAFVGTARVSDRTTLTDPVPSGGTVHFIQALSGG